MTNIKLTPQEVIVRAAEIIDPMEPGKIIIAPERVLEMKEKFTAEEMTQLNKAVGWMEWLERGTIRIKIKLGLPLPPTIFWAN